MSGHIKTKTLEPIQAKVTGSLQKQVVSTRVTLSDNAQTEVYVAVFPRAITRIRVAFMPEAERLVHWCGRHQMPYAMTGGYFNRSQRAPLGQTWMNGLKVQSLPFGEHWANKRGALLSDGTELTIAPLGTMPAQPRGDLMTAGPTLVHDSQTVVHPEAEFEGIPETWKHELDDDWTQLRAARTAIAYDSQRIWSIVSDGPLTDPVYRKKVGADNAPSAGLYLWEMAEILAALGATDALAMDGGGGATLIYDGKLINKPLAGKYDTEPPGTLMSEGRPIHTALAFVPL